MTMRAITADAVLTSAGREGDTVVYDNGVIVGVTDRSQVADDVMIEEHPGRTIVPPLIDSHLHPLGYAALVAGTSLKMATDMPELQDRLRIAADAAPPQGAVMAQRLDDTVLGRMPTRIDLDAVVDDKPVIAYRYCGHVAVANTAALVLAGIGPDTADPTGGSLDRDESGQPTGVLRETAVELVATALDPLIPPPDDETTLAALAGLVAVGLSRITGIVAAGEPLWCGVGAEMEALCRIAGRLPLPVDVIVIAHSPEELQDAADRIGSAGGGLRFWGWKGFADGSLGGHTAAMRQPYADRADVTGTLRLDPERALAMTKAALDLGGVAALHAIGDRAVDEVLGVYELAVAQGADPARLRIEHASVVSDQAITRMANAGIIASIQPAFLDSESEWMRARLGPHRTAYRFGDLTAAGVVMLGGSDCPVEPPGPLAGIAAATTRSGWADDQQLPVEAALGLFTTAPAAHLQLPAPLSPGAPADLVLVDGTIGSPTAAVAAVMQGGEWRTLQTVPWPG